MDVVWLLVFIVYYWWSIDRYGKGVCGIHLDGLSEWHEYSDLTITIIIIGAVSGLGAADRLSASIYLHLYHCHHRRKQEQDHHHINHAPIQSCMVDQSGLLELCCSRSHRMVLSSDRFPQRVGIAISSIMVPSLAIAIRLLEKTVVQYCFLWYGDVV